MYYANAGVYKKIVAAAKKKNCGILNLWAHSISNHMYWCAASSDGNGEHVTAKWLSISNHVTNIHNHHSDIFPRCEHSQLEDRKWLTKGKWVS